MKKSIPIIIEAVGNGFVVRPENSQSQAFFSADVLVFNKLIAAVRDPAFGDAPGTLCDFLVLHFADEQPAQFENGDTTAGLGRARTTLGKTGKP